MESMQTSYPSSGSSIGSNEIVVFESVGLHYELRGETLHQNQHKAHRLLDDCRAGLPMTVSQVNWALRILGEPVLKD